MSTTSIIGIITKGRLRSLIRTGIAIIGSATPTTTIQTRIIGTATSFHGQGRDHASFPVSDGSASGFSRGRTEQVDLTRSPAPSGMTAICAFRPVATPRPAARRRTGWIALKLCLSRLKNS
jgi:hypothetical protein